MELHKINFESIHFARATYQDEFAVFTIGSALIEQNEGKITDSCAEKIQYSLDEYARDNKRLLLPVQSDLTNEYPELTIELVGERESELLRKFIPNWRQVGSFVIRLDSIKLPTIAQENSKKVTLSDIFSQ